MWHMRGAALVALAAMVAGCGGETTGAPAVTVTPTPTPTPTPATSCALRDRQNFAFAVLNEWYLFPETLPVSLDPAPYASVQDYLDAKPYVSLVRIEVHVDNAGGQAANQTLTEKRALSVARWLIRAGVKCDRLIPVGFGSTRQSRSASRRAVWTPDRSAPSIQPVKA